MTQQKPVDKRSSKKKQEIKCNNIKAIQKSLYHNTLIILQKKA